MAQGMTYAEIAASLVVSLNTIRTHVKSIYGKLGVDNRTGAIEVAQQHHIL
jgi:LuxR family transcriptional regulator, maltose regulon positive regulatory protein